MKLSHFDEYQYVNVYRRELAPMMQNKARQTVTGEDTVIKIAVANIMSVTPKYMVE